MWDLLAEMMGRAVVNVWAENSLDLFVDVATAGWGLLEVRTKCGRKSKLNNELAARY
jgi:hypothetical protein